MLAKRIMVTDVETARPEEPLRKVMARMRSNGLRMLPVILDEGRVVGVFSTFSVLRHITPSYIASGDLVSLEYAPDMGVLRRHFDEMAERKIGELMDDKPLCVNEDESLLSVSAALLTCKRHEYALVINQNNQLQGVISAGDILDRMSSLTGEEFDA